MSQSGPRGTILAIDDTPSNIDTVRSVLADDYLLLAAVNAEMAFHVLDRTKPDLILLDIVMPGLDGYEICKRLKADPEREDIPVIFLTAKSEAEDEARGLALGAVDYVIKPISPPILRERVRTHLALKTARDQLKRQNEILEEKIEERTADLGELQDVAMVAMGALAERRDPETGNHIRRTQHYVRLLAKQLRNHPRFREILTPGNITMLFKSAPLHDIGKVGIPDAILLKPEELTPDEFEIMKRHPAYGRDAIAAARKNLSPGNTFLVFAEEIALSHHEWWDGTGYPEGLRGEEIPVSARLMAVADVYDAVVSRRVYKPPLPHETAVEIIRNGRGTHFDPDLVDAFLEIESDFFRIARQYGDAEDDSGPSLSGD